MPRPMTNDDEVADCIVVKLAVPSKVTRRGRPPKRGFKSCSKATEAKVISSGAANARQTRSRRMVAEYAIPHATRSRSDNEGDSSTQLAVPNHLQGPIAVFPQPPAVVTQVTASGTISPPTTPSTPTSQPLVSGFSCQSTPLVATTGAAFALSGSTSPPPAPPTPTSRLAISQLITPEIPKPTPPPVTTLIEALPSPCPLPPASPASIARSLPPASPNTTTPATISSIPISKLLGPFSPPTSPQITSRLAISQLIRPETPNPALPPASSLPLTPVSPTTRFPMISNSPHNNTSQQQHASPSTPINPQPSEGESTLLTEMEKLKNLVQLMYRNILGDLPRSHAEEERRKRWLDDPQQALKEEVFDVVWAELDIYRPG